MKPNFSDGLIAFMAPVMSGCVWVIPVPSCCIVGLAFSPAFLSLLLCSRVPGEANIFWLFPYVLSANGWNLLHPQMTAGVPPM